MTTECVIIHKTNRNDTTPLYKLYFVLENEIPDDIELYPVSVSEITTKHKVFSNINMAMGYYFGGKQKTLKPGEKCLFVGGKDWHMNKQDLRSYLTPESKKFLTEFEIMFPEFTEDMEPFFIDL